MSTNAQNLSSVEIDSTPILRLDMILESNLGRILDPSVADPSKADAARTILKAVTDTMPKDHLSHGKSPHVQAAVQRLQDTIVLDALSAVQDWAGERLYNKKHNSAASEVGKQTLRWLNSRATNLDFIISGHTAPVE
jgi:hypothetical protein